MNLRAKLGIFVLTAEEQRTIAFVVLALLLGLATQHYRHRHSQSTPPTNTENAPAETPKSDHLKSGAPVIPDQRRQ